MTTHQPETRKEALLSYLRFTPDEYRTIAALCHRLGLGKTSTEKGLFRSHATDLDMSSGRVFPSLNRWRQ
jgi:hypothetical protein